MVTNEQKKELVNDLEQFRHSVERLIELEDELSGVADELRGNTLHSPSFKSLDESKYQRGTMIYHNHIPELLDKEERLSKERDYYLFRVRRVSSFLQKLSDDEVKLVEMRYWNGYSLNLISQMMFMSKTTIFNKINDILEKMNAFTQK